MRSILSNHSAAAERHQHGVRTVKIRHFDVRCADTLRIMRIGAHTWSDIELICERDRREVVRGLGNLCVEHLDDVQLLRGDKRLEDRLSQSRALGIKRMRGVHQAALCFDAANHLRNGQDIRNALRQEQTDDLSRGRANLFADDDADAEITTESLCRFNRMMIGDTHHVEVDLFDALGKFFERRTRVARRDRVQMTVEPNPTSVGRWRRPSWNNIQQHEGD